MTGSSWLGDAVSLQLRRLDAALGIDHEGRSEWIWAAPAFIFVGTAAGFLVIGQITGMTAAVAAPVGVLIALVMAGISVAYMRPIADEAPGGPPPPQRDDTPLGSPGGPWIVVEHLSAGPRPRGAARGEWVVKDRALVKLAGTDASTASEAPAPGAGR